MITAVESSRMVMLNDPMRMSESSRSRKCRNSRNAATPNVMAYTTISMMICTTRAVVSPVPQSFFLEK